MVYKGLHVPVSSPLHGILQIDIRIVCDLGQCGTSCPMIALLGNTQHLAVTLVRCYVVIELKACDFEPGFISQLNMYQNMILTSTGGTMMKV